MSNLTHLLFPIEASESDHPRIESSEQITVALARLLLQVLDSETAKEVIEDES